MKTAMKTQILPPQRGPLIGLKDFPEGDPKPIDQPPFTPATANPRLLTVMKTWPRRKVSPKKKLNRPNPVLETQTASLFDVEG